MLEKQLARVVPFPKPCQPAQKYRLTDEIIITFPFSKAECEIIQEHIKACSPEICLGIVDPTVRDVIERWVSYVWLPHPTTAQASVKKASNLS